VDYFMRELQNLSLFSVYQYSLMVLEVDYLVNAWQAVDDAEHNDGIAMRIVSYLYCHCIQQHLIETVREQRLWQLAEKVFEHACSIKRQHRKIAVCINDDTLATSDISTILRRCTFHII